jgi:hypothetical protein
MLEWRLKFYSKKHDLWIIKTTRLLMVTQHMRERERERERERDCLTWYSLISDLSKPGMKRVTDFWTESKLTEGYTKVDAFLSCSFVFWLNELSALLQSTEESFGRNGRKDKDNGRNFWATSRCSSEGSSVYPNAPHIWPPAWVVQPQYRNAEDTEIDVLGSMIRKHASFEGSANHTEIFYKI